VGGMKKQVDLVLRSAYGYEAIMCWSRSRPADVVKGEPVQSIPFCEMSAWWRGSLLPGEQPRRHISLLRLLLLQ